MSSKSKWKLLSGIIIASVVLGVASWQQFILKPTPPESTLILSQISNSEVRFGQIVNVVTTVENNVENEITVSRILVELPLGLEVLKVETVRPDGSKVSDLSIDANHELKQGTVLLKAKQKLTVSFSLNTTLESRTSNLTTTVYAIYKSGGIFGVGTETTTITKSAQTTIRVPLEAWYSVLRDIRDQSWLRYVLANNLCIEDGKLTDQEVTYLKHPNPENADRLLKSYMSAMSQIAKIGPQLATEFPRVPDVRPNNATVEALEDIICRVLRSSNDELRVFDVMLKEGIPEKRKFCSPLQALEWYCEDNELAGKDPMAVIASGDESVIKNRMYDFIDSVWKKTYETSKWEDFQVVVDRLNSPRLVSTFMKNNISYDTGKYEEMKRTGIQPRTITPAETFKLRKGICTEQAWFAYYPLSKNGYVYDNFDFYTSGAACILELKEPLGPGKYLGHSICLYKDDGNFYVINNGIIQGPFSSIQKAADAAFPSWKEYAFCSSY